MDITAVPSQMAEYLGTNITTAQLIISTAVILAILVPVMILSRGKNAVTVWIICIFLGEAIVLGLGWAPFWLMIMTIMLTALGWAFFTSRGMTGGG